MASKRKRFNKGQVVEVNPSTTQQQWTDARYLGTTTHRGERWHAAMVGDTDRRIEVPSRRIRAKGGTP